MLERFLDQIGEVLRLCEDTDGILVVNREGIIEYHRIPLNSYWCSQDTVPFSPLPFCILHTLLQQFIGVSVSF